MNMLVANLKCDVLWFVVKKSNICECEESCVRCFIVVCRYLVECFVAPC